MQDVRRVYCRVAPAFLLFMGIVQGQELGERERLFEEEKRRALKELEEPYAGDEFLLEYGGWQRSTFYDYQTGERLTRSRLNYDFRLWGDLIARRHHRLFVRVLTNYTRYLMNGDPEGGNDSDFVTPRLDQGFYEYRSDPSGAGLKLRLGRQAFVVGSGIAYNDVHDGARISYDDPRFGSSLFGSRNIRSQDDIDRSLPDPDNSRRLFAGGDFYKTLFGRHTAYAFWVMERDRNHESPAVQEQEFDFDTAYHGLGLRGSLLPRLSYRLEGISQRGERFASSFGPNAIGDDEKIRARGGLARLEVLPEHPWVPVLSIEYLFGSGDRTSLSVTDTVLGNFLGTDDQRFLGFGYIFTGTVLSPRLSNLKILHFGASVEPLRDLEWAVKFKVGTDMLAFRKHRSEGGISDLTIGDGRDVGEEVDVYADWQILSDLQLQTRYGLFFDGRAYTDGTTRHFGSVSLTYTF